MPAPEAEVRARATRLYLVHLPRLRQADGKELRLNEKDAALLALAVLEAPVARTRAAALLWPGGKGLDPEAAERRALNNLRQRLFRLGRWAGRDLLGAGSTLALDRGVEHDLVLDAERLLADGGAAAGELLGNHRYDDCAELAMWVDAARQRWRASRADALLGLVARLEKSARLGDALRVALRLVTEEPLMEHASRTLMRLHYRRGDRGAALAEFERCRRALYEQHGDAPSDETIALSLEIARADAPPSAKPVALPLALRHPPRTVGRDAVLARAEHRWSERGIVLLVGPAGIGKSRVLADLAARWHVSIQLKCLPESSASNFGLLRLLAAALAPLVRERIEPDLALWLDWLADPYGRSTPVPGVQNARIVAVCAELMVAANAAGVDAIAIEDLHYADEPSLEVFTSLLPASGTAAVGVRWLLSSRDTELPAPLQRWLDRQPLAAYPLVAIEPLDEAATVEFLAGLGLSTAHPQAAAQLHRHCGGHPLFMLQVLRQLQLAGELDGGAWPARLPLPDDAMVSASQRLARADPAAQQLAFLAALCGPDFSADLMCRLLGQNATQLLGPWRRLEELHIFGPQGFAHDLIREAVLSVLPQPLAPLLHREIAAALERSGAEPLRRALHWEAAGDSARAATEFAAAARVAEDCGLDVRAIEWLRRASANHRKAGQIGEGFECDWRCGHLMLAATSASDAAAMARALVAEASAPRQRALAGELLARVKVEQQDRSATDDARAALALVAGLDDAALALRCRLRLAESLALELQFEQALSELEAASPAIPEADQELRFGWSSDRASILASLGRRDEAVAVQRQMLDQALAERNYAQASSAAGFCATHLAYLCRVNESVAAAEQSLELARQAGIERGLVLVDQMGLAGNLGDLGRFAEALEMSEKVIAGLREAGLDTWAINAANDRAVMFMRLGRLDLAQQLVAAPIDNAPPWARGARLMVRARIRQWHGLAAGELFRQAIAVFGEAGLQLHDYARHKITVEAARTESPAAALGAAGEALLWAQGHQHEAFARYLQMVAIEALTRLGRAPEAAARARELGAAGGIDEEAFGFYLPELLLVMRDALQAAGDEARAARHATAAVAWIEDRAARHVPPLFAGSFRQRNPINVRLMRRRESGPVAAR